MSVSAIDERDIDRIAGKVVELLEGRGMAPGRDFTPKELMQVFGYPRDIAYHPRLVGRYKAGQGKQCAVYINREAFMRRRASGGSIIAD